MFPNGGPSWSGYPPQNPGYPYYYPSAYYPPYNNATNVPPSNPSAPGPSSLSPTTPTTRLAANAPKFVPAGTADSTPVAPSPGFSLPRRSSTLKTSDPRTGERIVPQPPDPANRGAAGVERPLTKKERKRLVKLEAEEKMKAEAEAKERLRKEDAEKKAKKEAEDAEIIKRIREEVLKKREEEARKREEEELRRKKEEELRKKEEEEDRIQREKEERERKEREEAEAKAKADEEQRLIRLAQEAVARFLAEKQEKGPPAGSGSGSARPPSANPKQPVKWGSVWSTEDPDIVVNTEGTQSPSAESDYVRTLLSGKYKHPNSRNPRPDPPPVRKEKPETAKNLDNVDAEPQDDAYTVNIPSPRLTGQVRGRGGSVTSSLIHERTSASGTTSEERFLASQRRLEAIAASQAASSGPQPGVPTSPSYSQGFFMARGRPKDQNVARDDPAEDGQRHSGRTPAEPADPHALTAISQLSKQMEVLLQEVRELRGEVRELRSEAQSEDRREPSESPERESSAPEVQKTATAIQQYFIMKEGELDFSPGDVITILDAPEGTRRGWLYGEVNITKRGFFPATYVKLEQ